MKQILMILTVLALCVFTACGRGEQQPEQQLPADSQVTEQEEEKKPTRVEVDMTDESGESYFDASADMPETLPESVPENTLDALWAEADAFLARAEEEAAMAHTADESWTGEYLMMFSLFHQDDAIVSVTADLYSYSSQAAYAFGQKKGYTFDAATGERLAMGDFLENSAPEEIARVISAMIQNVGETDLYFPDLEARLAAEFREDQWWTDGKTLWVYYAPGTVAPMSMGGLEFPISVGKID